MGEVANQAETRTFNEKQAEDSGKEVGDSNRWERSARQVGVAGGQAAQIENYGGIGFLYSGINMGDKRDK